MFELSNRRPEKVKMEWRQEVVEEFDRFVAFAAQHQDHANRTNVLEYIVGQFMRTSLSREFREWTRLREEAGRSAESDQGDAKTEGEKSDEVVKARVEKSELEDEDADAKPSMSAEKLQRVRDEIARKKREREKA